MEISGGAETAVTLVTADTLVLVDIDCSGTFGFHNPSLRFASARRIFAGLLLPLSIVCERCMNLQLLSVNLALTGVEFNHPRRLVFSSGIG